MDTSELRRHHAAAIFSLLRAVERPKILVFVTVYNEPASTIYASLAGILANVCSPRNQSSPLHCGDVVVCLLVDGVDTMHPTTKSFLLQLPLDPATLVLDQDGFKVTVHQLSTEGAATMWFDKPAQRGPLHADTRASPFTHHGVVRLVTLVKRHNAGKLDSHAWCYSVIAPALAPLYCVQLDAGTVPDATGLLHLQAYLEKRPNILAAASLILLPASDFGGTLWNWFQRGDFLFQRLMLWPMEVNAGHLGVIPGQFSMVRWAGYSTRSCAYPSPKWVDRYLRGLRATALLERLMFLAEDRVLALELLRGHSTIGYASHAVAITDPCTSLKELLQQRRRWINSTFACRLALLARVRRIWTFQGCSFAQGARYTYIISTTMAYLMWDWLFITVSASTVSVLHYAAVRHSLHRSTVFATVIYWCAVSLISIEGLLAGYCLTSNPRKAVFAFTVVAGAHAIVLGVLLACAIVAVEPVVLLSGCVLICALLIKASRYPSVLRRSLHMLGAYIFLMFPCQAILSSYALLHLDDVSWGTKNLMRAQGLKRRGAVMCVQICWFVMNCAGVISVLRHPHASGVLLLCPLTVLWTSALLFRGEAS